MSVTSRLRGVAVGGMVRRLGAAVTFVVSAVAGVVGNFLTGRFGWALAVFGALLVVGGGVTYWLERGLGRSTQNDVRPPVGRLDVRGAHGVQVGDGGLQVNYFDDAGVRRPRD